MCANPHPSYQHGSLQHAGQVHTNASHAHLTQIACIIHGKRDSKGALASMRPCAVLVKLGAQKMQNF